MYESWDNYWAEFLWFGDGSTNTGIGGEGQYNLENWEDGNQTEKIYIAGFQGIKEVVRDTMKMTMEQIEKELETDATSSTLGYDSLLFEEKNLLMRREKRYLQEYKKIFM